MKLFDKFKRSAKTSTEEQAPSGRTKPQGKGQGPRPATDAATNNREAWRLVMDHVDVSPQTLMALGQVNRAFRALAGDNRYWRECTPQAVVAAKPNANYRELFLRRLNESKRNKKVSEDHRFVYASQRFAFKAPTNKAAARYWGYQVGSFQHLKYTIEDYDLARLRVDLDPSLTILSPALQAEPSIFAAAFRKNGTFNGVTAPYYFDNEDFFWSLGARDPGYLQHFQGRLENRLDMLMYALADGTVSNATWGKIFPRSVMIEDVWSTLHAAVPENTPLRQYPALFDQMQQLHTPLDFGRWIATLDPDKLFLGPYELFNDHAFMLSLAPRAPTLLARCGAGIYHVDFVRQVLAINGLNLQGAEWYREDLESCVIAVKQNPAALQYVPSKLRSKVQRAVEAQLGRRLQA